LTDPLLAAFLSRRAGLVAETLGEGSVRAIQERRARALGVAPERYALHLEADPEEASAFLEDVLIPETWFYRDHTPFAWITAEASRGRWGRPLRVLSVPCSSGEEVYSAVIALREAGLAPEQIQAEGVDLSRRALEQARRGAYGPFSLRGVPPWLPERYLLAGPGGLRIPPELQGCARFRPGNALDLRPDEAPWDLILCRNLLIYLDPDARRRLLTSLTGLLARDGALILGHADGWPHAGLGLRPAGPPGAFAFERGTPASAPRHRPPAPLTSPAPRVLPVPPVEPRTPRPAAAPAVVSPGDLAEARRLADRGLLDEALRLCAERVKTHPLDPEAHRLRGVILVARGALGEAEAALRRALYLAPDDDEALGHLALLAERAGRPEQAASFRRRRGARQEEP
jgi:chemotaxis protein methyltransferase WspC